MPNSLKSRIKKLEHQGLLSKKDLSRIIVIPNNATNGDLIKAIFPNIDTEQIEDIIDVYGMSKCRVTYDTDWWNETYKSCEKGEDK